MAPRTWNRIELTEAASAINRARDNYDRIRALPTAVGARIRWKSNKLVWRRVGDNAWLPEHELPVTVTPPLEYPSEHIARYGWEPVE